MRVICRARAALVGRRQPDPGTRKLPESRPAGIKRDSFFGAPAAPHQEPAMSRVCQITGKRPMTGNTVSHANNRRRRRFLPNLHVQRFWLESERRFVSLRVSTRGLRTIEKKGIEKVVAELRAEGIEL